MRSIATCAGIYLLVITPAKAREIGAVIGTAICPGVGTVIGGVVGAIAGGIIGSGAGAKLVDWLF